MTENEMVLAFGGLVAALLFRFLLIRTKRRTPTNEPDIHVIWSTSLVIAGFFIQQLVATREDPLSVEAIYIGTMTTLFTLAVFSIARAVELRRHAHAVHVLEVLREVDTPIPATTRRQHMVEWMWLSPNGTQLARIRIPEHYGPPLDRAYPSDPDFLLYRDGVLIYDATRESVPLFQK